MNSGLDDNEHDVMMKINAVYNGMLGLGLNCNEAEFCAAIHTLQGFVKQRVLHRTFGDYWNNWFDE